MPNKLFEQRSGSSSKFWEINVRGNKTNIRYGRIGTDGRSIEKSYASADEAKKAADKLIEQKTAKGYKPVGKAAEKAAAKVAPRIQKKAATKKKKAARKKTARRKKLNQVPFKTGDVVDVTGMLEAAHSGAVADDFEGTVWTHIAVFQKWKITGGEIMPGRMQIRESELSNRQTSSRMSRYQPYSLHRVEVKMTRPRGFDCWVGQLVKYRGKAKESAFEKAATQMQKKVTFRDPELGRFEFDRAFSHFEARNARWMKKKCCLTLHVKNENKPERCLEFARAIFEAQTEWNETILEYAVKELLQYANAWRAEDLLKPFTAEGFRKRIRINAVEVHQSGRSTFWLDSGTIFTDHAIQVEVTRTGKPKTASIA
ncbi:MAG: DUF2262 domain-containing protein [Planctomycetota bacterium]